MCTDAVYSCTVSLASVNLLNIRSARRVRRGGVLAWKNAKRQKRRAHDKKAVRVTINNP